MSDERRALFEIDGRLPKLGYSFPLALQHLVAMIVGCVTPAIIISSVAGLDEAGSILLIQSSLVCAALSTLLQLFGIKGICGARLPVIMGVSFAYLATMGDIAGRFGLAEIFGAQLVGGLVAIVIGVFAKRLQKLFPPLITGTVVFTIGLSLYPTAITYMAGGSGNPMFGSWQNWLVAIFTLVVVTVLNHFGRGMVKLASMPADVMKLAFAVTIHEAEQRRQNFGMVSNAFIRVVNEKDGKEIARFDLSEDASTNTSLIFGELYRHNDEWKFRAVGQGFDGGLGALARNYGVNI